MNLVEETVRDARHSVEQAYRHYGDMDLMEKELYGQWLAQTYYYVHHVTRILAFAAAKCDLYQDHDLHFRLIDSLNEEKGHDTMILNDLKALGADLETYPELIETRNFYQSLFYMVETYGPYALVGYFIPQEGLASEKLGPLYKELARQHGEEPCTFLKEHCELDIEHFNEALEFLKIIPEEKLPVIKMGMYRSAELYSRLMKAIAEKSSSEFGANYWRVAKDKLAPAQTARH